MSSPCLLMSGTTSARRYLRSPGTVRTGLSRDSRVKPSMPGTSYHASATVGSAVSVCEMRGKVCTIVVATCSSGIAIVAARYVVSRGISSAIPSSGSARVSASRCGASRRRIRRTWALVRPSRLRMSPTSASTSVLAPPRAVSSGSATST